MGTQIRRFAILDWQDLHRDLQGKDGVGREVHNVVVFDRVR